MRLTVATDDPPHSVNFAAEGEYIDDQEVFTVEGKDAQAEPEGRQRRAKTDTWKDWTPERSIPSFAEIRFPSKMPRLAAHISNPILSTCITSNGDMLSGDSAGDIVLWTSKATKGLQEEASAVVLHRCRMGWSSASPSANDAVTALTSSAQRSDTALDVGPMGARVGHPHSIIAAGCESGSIHVLEQKEGESWKPLYRIEDVHNVSGRVFSLNLVQGIYICASFLSPDLMRYGPPQNDQSGSFSADYKEGDYIEAAKRLASQLKAAKSRRGTFRTQGREMSIDTETTSSLSDSDFENTSNRAKKVKKTKFLDSPWNWAWGVDDIHQTHRSESDLARQSYLYKQNSTSDMLSLSSEYDKAASDTDTSKRRGFYAAAALIEDIACNADNIYRKVLESDDSQDINVPERIAVTRCRAFPKSVISVLSNLKSALKKRKRYINYHARVVKFELNFNDGEDISIDSRTEPRATQRLGTVLEVDILSDTVIHDGLPCVTLPGGRIATYGGKGDDSERGTIQIIGITKVTSKVELSFCYNFNDVQDMASIPVSLAVLPDGRRLAAGYRDGVIRIHDSGVAMCNGMGLKKKTAFFVGDEVTRRSDANLVGVVSSPNWSHTIRVKWNASDFEEELPVAEIQHFDTTPHIKTVVLHGCKTPQQILCALQGGRRLMSASKDNDGEFFIWDHIASSNHHSRFVIPAISGMSGISRTEMFTNGEIMLSVKEKVSTSSAFKELDNALQWHPGIGSPLAANGSKRKTIRRVSSESTGISSNEEYKFNWSKIVKRVRKRGTVESLVEAGRSTDYLVRLGDGGLVRARWHHLKGVRISDITYLKDGMKNGSFVVALESGRIRKYDMQFYATNIFNLFDFGTRQASNPEIEKAISVFLEDAALGGEQRICSYLFEMTTVLWASVRELQDSVFDADILFLGHLGRVCKSFEFVLTKITDRSQRDAILSDISHYVMIMSEDDEFMKWISERAIPVDAFSAMASTGIWRAIIRAKETKELLIALFYLEFFFYICLFLAVYFASLLRLRPGCMDGTPFVGKETTINIVANYIGLFLSGYFLLCEIFYAYNIREDEIVRINSPRSRMQATKTARNTVIEVLLSGMETALFKLLLLRLCGTPLATIVYWANYHSGADEHGSLLSFLQAFLRRGDEIVDGGVVKSLLKAGACIVVALVTVFGLVPALVIWTPIRSLRSEKLQLFPWYLVHRSWWKLKIWTYVEERYFDVIDADLVTFFGFAKLYRTNSLNGINLLSVVLSSSLFVSFYFDGYDAPAAEDTEETDPRGEVYSVAVYVNMACMWVRILFYLNSIDEGFSGAVKMMIRVVSDLSEFLAIMFLLLFMFLLLLYVRGAEESWTTDREGERDDDGNPFKTFWKSFLTLSHLALIGDISFIAGHDLDVADDVIVWLYIFAMAIVMVNVLIAIVSNSFDESMGSSSKAYWASRLLLVNDMKQTWAHFPALLRAMKKTRERYFGRLDYQMITKNELEPQASMRGKRKAIGRVNDISNIVTGNTAEMGSRIIERINTITEELQSLKTDATRSSVANQKLTKAIEEFLDIDSATVPQGHAKEERRPQETISRKGKGPQPSEMQSGEKRNAAADSLPQPPPRTATRKIAFFAPDSPLIIPERGTQEEDADASDGEEERLLVAPATTAPPKAPLSPPTPTMVVNLDDARQRNSGKGEL